VLLGFPWVVGYFRAPLPMLEVFLLTDVFSSMSNGMNVYDPEVFFFII
jgi:hypothetical protein